VIDGDTLVVTILLPQCEMDEKLRLRGLDCPEMDTPAGKVAKRYVETLLVETAEVTITTSKVDKYDRYLADVHLRQRSGEAIFLNNALLAHGHAVPMGEAQEEWTP
jgi:endonuclease YncB( thermonuclease family)